MKRIVLFVLSTLAATSALAGSNATSTVTYIGRIFAYENYFVVEVADRVIPNPAGCDSPDANRRVKMHRDASTDHIYSTLLAAKLAGTPLTFGVKGSECYTWGAGGIPVMYRVDVL